MATWQRALVAATVVAGLAAFWLTYRINSHPSLEPYRSYALPAADDGRGLRVVFLGVSTLLLHDGETAILTDGFFTRPGKFRMLVGKIGPDRELIARSLERAGIRRLAAVIAVHSHYDHAMDSPEVAQRTGALLIGSASTANVARGWGMTEDRLRIVHGGEAFSFGRFQVTILPSRHFPHPVAQGDITEPLRPPAYFTAYREGGSYSVLIEHEGKSLLIHASAGFIEGGLRGRKAEVVFLGLAGMGTADPAYRQAYWREVVVAVGARRVIPVHWDDFTLPLDQPLTPMPRLLDNFEVSMEFLLEQGRQNAVDVRLAPAWEKFDPFQGLAR